jgi:hypothetical protein
MIRLQYGTENNTQSEAKAHFFVWNGITEKQIGVASRDNEFPVSLQAGQYSKNPAISGMSSEVGGYVVSAAFNVTEGTIIKLHANVRKYQGLPKCASVLLRAREEGPLTELKLNLIDAPNSNFKQLVSQGRFERITLDEAKAFGYHCAPAFEKFFNEDAIDDAFEFKILDAGKSKPEFTLEEYQDTKTGEKIIRKKPVERRRIILRRNTLRR